MAFLKTVNGSLPLIFLQPQVSTTAPGGIQGGAAVTNTGTISHPTVTYGAANATGRRRTNFSGSTASGSAAGMVQAGTYWYGINSGDGLDITFTYSIPSELSTTGGAFFAGLNSTAAVLAGDPSSLTTGLLGIGYDSADASSTSNYSWYTNVSGGTATKTKIPGLNRNAAINHRIELRIRAIDSLTLNISVKDLDIVIGNTTGNIVLNQDVGPGTAYTNVPAVETLLGAVWSMYNGAVASACQLQLLSFEGNSAG